MPNTLEFRPGHDYYFISTASREDLHRRIHGYCLSNNMKVVFKVGDNTKRKGSGSSSSSTSMININLVEGTTTSTDISVSKYYFSDKTQATSKKPRRKHRDRHRKRQRNQKQQHGGGGGGDVVTSVTVEPGAASDIAQNDKPNVVAGDNEESLVKRVKNMIKQEASTRMNAAPPPAFTGRLTCLCAAVVLPLMGLP